MKKILKNGVYRDMTPEEETKFDEIVNSNPLEKYNEQVEELLRAKENV